MILSRRRLLLGTVAVAGGGLALAWLRPDPAGRPLDAPPGTLQPNAWLQLTPGGEVILQIDKAELGQGVITGYVTLLAEELDVPPGAVQFRFAPVHPLFQDPVQLTGESMSMRRRFLPIRRTGAAARQMLLAAAGRRWQLPAAELITDGQGFVMNPATGARLGYGELAPEAATLAVPQSPPLRAAGDFRYIGGRVPRPDIPAKVTGAAAFGVDTRLPGLIVAVVRRPPRLRAAPVSHDASRARALGGVVDVIPIHTGIAVLGETFWHARRGAEALDVEWEPGPLAGLDDARIRAAQAEALVRGRRHRRRNDGNVDNAFSRVDEVLSADYRVPYLAHATMEPMNATLWFRDGGCEAWVPNQGPDMVRQFICDATGLPRDRVQVRSTYAGGGFGRRATMEYVVEAVEIARRSDRPVQLVWTREDDLRHGLYRESSLHRLKAALNADGTPRAWEHRLTAAGLNQLVVPISLALLAPEWLPAPAVGATGRAVASALDWAVGSFGARDGAVTMPYRIPDVRVEVVDCDPGVPHTIWRSVGHSYNAFAVECFVDELAHAAGRDPAAYRRGLLTHQPRHLAVLEALLARSDWGHPPAGRYQGLAVHECFGSVVGQVAEVSVGDDGAIRVHRVCCVVDCGLAINPDVVRQQLEGGIIFGLSAALYGEINLEDGAVRQGNFDRYRLVRLADSPAIDVHILPGGDTPEGIGETGVPAIAPAVANAVFAATGRRLRELPLRL